MEWTKEEAKAADAALKELYIAKYKAEALFLGREGSLHRAVGDDYRRKYNPNSGWKLTNQEAFDKVQELSDSESTPAYRVREAVEAAHKYMDARQALRDAQKAIGDHDAEHYKGWQRYFLVTGGHIHRNTACHSLRITTQIGWLPELSGETIAEAVEAYGTLLCTHCFPEAPVEWTIGNKPAVKEGYCTGQGKQGQDISWRYRSGVGTCPECSQKVSVSSLGKVLKHKLPQ